MARPPPVQVAHQPLPVADGDVLLRFEQGAGRRERLIVALFLVAAAKVPIQARGALAHLAGGGLHPFLEIGLAAEDEVETPRDLPRHLDMGGLVLADGNEPPPGR